jgi:hypothetical protein
MLFLDPGNTLVAVFLAEPFQNVAAGALCIGAKLAKTVDPKYRPTVAATLPAGFRFSPILIGCWPSIASA